MHTQENQPLLPEYLEESNAESLNPNRTSLPDDSILITIREAYNAAETLPGWYREISKIFDIAKDSLADSLPGLNYEDFKQYLSMIPGAWIRPEYVNKLTGQTVEVVKINDTPEVPTLPDDVRAKLYDQVLGILNRSYHPSFAGQWLDLVTLAPKLKNGGLNFRTFGFHKLLPFLETVFQDRMEKRMEGPTKVKLLFADFNPSNQLSSPLADEFEKANQEYNVYDKAYKRENRDNRFASRQYKEDNDKSSRDNNARFAQKDNKTILAGCNPGDKIEISSFGLTKTGVVKELTPDFIELETPGGFWTRIKYSAVSTAQLLEKAPKPVPYQFTEEPSEITLTRSKEEPAADTATHDGSDLSQTLGTDIYKPEELAAPSLKVLGKINLPDDTTRYGKNQTKQSSGPISLLKTLRKLYNPSDNSRLLPSNGILLSMGNRYGWIQPHGDTGKNIYVPVNEIVEHNGILESPQPGDEVLFTLSENALGAIAVCVHKQCTSDVIETLIERIRPYDQRTANRLESHLSQDA